MEPIRKVSEIESPTDADYQYALDLMVEAEAISTNTALMKSIEAYGKRKAGEYRSIGDLQKRANEIALNPGQYAAQEDEFVEKKRKRLEKKKSA